MAGRRVVKPQGVNESLSGLTRREELTRAAANTARRNQSSTGKRRAELELRLRDMQPTLYPAFAAYVRSRPPARSIMERRSHIAELALRFAQDRLQMTFLQTGAEEFIEQISPARLQYYLHKYNAGPASAWKPAEQNRQIAQQHATHYPEAWVTLTMHGDALQANAYQMSPVVHGLGDALDLQGRAIRDLLPAAGLQSDS